jgi:Transposase domain (DUF772)
MKQLTFSATGFEGCGKTTRRAAFLAEMERVVPWTQLCALIEPFYPKPGNGRPPLGLERMLRIYFLQQWFNLSDPGDTALSLERPFPSVFAAKEGLVDILPFSPHLGSPRARLLSFVKVAKTCALRVQ